MAIKFRDNDGQWKVVQPDKIKYWNGQAWVQVTSVKYWDGSQWKPF